MNLNLSKRVKWILFPLTLFRTECNSPTSSEIFDINYYLIKEKMAYISKNTLTG